MISNYPKCGIASNASSVRNLLICKLVFVFARSENGGASGLPRHSISLNIAVLSFRGGGPGPTVGDVGDVFERNRKSIIPSLQTTDSSLSPPLPCDMSLAFGGGSACHPFRQGVQKMSCATLVAALGVDLTSHEHRRHCF